ncbi:MAG: hypothetical protein ACYTEZ_02980 [Planctomycetota bacterium]
MRVVLALVVLVCVGCRLSGAQTLYGVADNDMNFGELDVILAEREEDNGVQAVPFLVVGEGTLPEEYGPQRESFQRTSVGQKVRFPARLFRGRVILYFEGGAMVSYYRADAIGTPWELEFVAGVGSQINLGKGWGLDLGVRARQPAGNGSNHDGPSHAPHDTDAEFVFGLKKDF